MQTFGRALAAIVLGGLILFPGVELLRFLVTNVLGLYHEMSLTDCLLVFVVILLCALLLSQHAAGRRGESARKPQLTMLGAKPKERRRPRSEERSRSTRSSRRR